MVESASKEEEKVEQNMSQVNTMRLPPFSLESDLFNN